MVTPRNRRESAARGTLRSHRLPNLNASANARTRDIINMALVRLVGAVQDLLAASGYSVSQLIDGVLKKQGRLVRAAHGAAAAVAPRAAAWVGRGNVTGGSVTVALVQRLLALFGVKPEYISADNMATLLKRIAPTIVKILKGVDVDLRPAVSAVVMALNPSALRALAQSTLQNLLNTYVYAQYKPSSSEGSAMCTMCAQADCRRAPTKVRSNAPARMAAVVEKVVWSINRLLEVEGRGHTLTSVLRRAIDSNLDPRVATAVEWGSRLTGQRVVAVVGLIVSALYPVLSKRLNAMGLIVSQKDFSALVLKELQRVRGFLAKQPGANLEPFIVKLVAAASPIGIVQGAIAAQLRNASPNQFCKFCASTYSSCTRP